ncbi:hemolysin D [Massilia sp. Root351]|uniref:HlyD family type I secretion periplasmic adaptor subunit n=1 Tax=Massilia sp. Root351 TaxID=1736522 RepID=UPI0007094B12|nr:HlyD family type I secretion periplasmic adaptor subunit [Massilia sp. Root351]KQV88712.1 hemolysin D [Massilia sp. Root351]
MKLIEKKDLASDVITHDVSPLTVHTDPRAYARLGWIVVLVGFVGFLVWGFLAPLDKGVPMTGTVARESSRKQVQHQAGGTIEKILVHDGERVKAGQVLVKMNEVQTKSVADITLAQYLSSKATETRLLAERDGKSKLTLAPELDAYKNDPRLLENLALQNQLFTSRQLSLQNELAAIEESIAGAKAQRDGLQESKESKKQQLVFLKEQLDNMRELGKDGYVARSRVLDLERTYAQLNGAISEDIGNIARAQRQMAELTLRRAMRQQDFQKEVRSQLSDVQREGDALGARLNSQQFDLANVSVKAPVDGLVVGMNVFTEGGVVAPGFRMMDIVPVNDGLIVDGQLPVNLVDRVHKGLPVELMFSAFNANTTPHIPGVVDTISADRLVEDRTGNPYYKVRVKVTAEGMKLIADKKLDIQAGMPVEVFVKTGERSMMSYLFKPVVDRAKTSMSEE